jgi:hypothetical protein
VSGVCLSSMGSGAGVACHSVLKTGWGWYSDIRMDMMSYMKPGTQI